MSTALIIRVTQVPVTHRPPPVPINLPKRHPRFDQIAKQHEDAVTAKFEELQAEIARNAWKEWALAIGYLILMPALLWGTYTLFLHTVEMFGMTIAGGQSGG